MENQLPVRIGAVSYLNSKPLIEFLAQRLPEGSRLSLDLPSRLADQLAAGTIDVGLIPAIEYFRHAEKLDLRILSDACIACRGKVHSVRLFFRVAPERVRKLAVDEGSRTSVALASILLRDRYGVEPEMHALPIGSNPDEGEADAVLVIGDRAMHPQVYRSFIANWDLGEEWYRDTQLPFVFAMWVGRHDERYPGLAGVLQNARDEGVGAVEFLCLKYASDYQLSLDDCRDYFLKYLQFTMTADALRGLELFHRKSVRLGLASAIQRTNWLTPISLPFQYTNAV